MTDADRRLAALRRPPLLCRAAAAGAAAYDRPRDLARLVPAAGPSGGERVLATLLDTEEALERARLAGAAGYSPVRHVAVMIALLGEARSRVAAGG